MSVDIVEWDGDLGPDGAVDDCGGAGDDAEEGTGATAESRGWGKGWPNCQSDRLNTVVVTDKVRLSVRREIAPLVAWLCQETIDRGYALRGGQCWGFACRAIRGSRSPSNHSWGLAVDLNSLKNPMGSTLVTNMPRWMPELWTDHGFRWGGSYNGRKDAMHFEFLGTPDDAHRQIARTGRQAVGGPEPKKAKKDDAGGAPTFPLPKGHWFGMDPADDRAHNGQRPGDRPHIVRIQKRLARLDFHVGHDGADGWFGPNVQTAVEGFQRKESLHDDGVVGPKTWSALW
jgi:D-alanyl-D-alanine carboxypeptidase/Putative peptidoglycan binding domain